MQIRIIQSSIKIQLEMNMRYILCPLIVFLSLGAINSSLASEAKPAPVESKKILVAYFSRGGNTKYAAEQIQKATGGTLFEIKPVNAYPAEYKDCAEQAKKEINEGYKPSLAAKVDNMEQYDVVFVGTPNWWSSIAPPLASFLSDNKWEGKTVITFVTHGGGGMARCESEVKKLIPGAKTLKGKAFPGRDIKNASSDIAKWVRETIIIKKQDK